MKTLVVGLDGADWSVVDPLVAAGRMPNTASLLEDGCRADLRSTTPPVSPPAWTSIYTGVNPGKHGVYDFSTLDERYVRRTLDSSDRKSTPFWQIFDDEGVSMGLFKLPITWPVPEIDGFFVSGFPTPDATTEYTYPRELRTVVGSPTELFEDDGLIADGDLAAFEQNLREVTVRQTDDLLECLDDRNPEYVMTVYEGSDRIQHFFWRYMDESHDRHVPSEFEDAIYGYYELFDRQLGRILESTSEETNVVLVSDHGFGPLETDLNVEHWLAEEGYLAWADDPDETYDWERTDAFFSTVSGQSLHANLETRFDRGSVSADEYDALVDELVDGLRSLTHPETGERLLRTVRRSNDYYSGWATERRPDVVMEARERFAIEGGPADELLSPSTQYEQDRSGDHEASGVFVASGPAFRNDALDSPLSVLDFAPMVLFVHGCPVPESMDGTVPTAVFDDAFFERREVRRTDQYGLTDAGSHSWSDDAAESVEETLKDLGYLE